MATQYRGERDARDPLRTPGFRAICWSIVLHGFVVSLSSQLLLNGLHASRWQTWQRFEASSLLLSAARPETLESLREITIIAPDGLPLESELAELAMHPDAPELVAVHASPSPSHAAGEWPQIAEPSRTANAPATAGTIAGGGYEGRLNPLSRAQLLGTRGGTPESEAAVTRALTWLAAHQLSNGAWSFDHRAGPCGGRCRDSGTTRTTHGATALALLPLLGAGHTSQHGSHQQVVRRGLQYLVDRGRSTPRGFDLHENNMYAQGLATLALCENYGMTGDAAFREPCQGAVDFIVHAQHDAGGWRYFPKQPGDMTVFGWQLLALESARRSGLHVPPRTMTLAAQFLNACQSSQGSTFGYTEAGAKPVPTAIGWLCRMYYGATRRDAQLVAGVEQLRTWGVSQNDLYFNFHATQVLSQYPGHEWTLWNEQLREQLIATQATAGHEAGSWHMPHEHAHAGGRLYSTSLATLILEVYYRHLPIFADAETPRVAKLP